MNNPGNIKNMKRLLLHFKIMTLAMCCCREIQIMVIFLERFAFRIR